MQHTSETTTEVFQEDRETEDTGGWFYFVGDV